MAQLTTKMVNRLPASAFAIPSQRKYPIMDREHAANALARVTQFGTAQEKAQVRAAVKRRYPDLPYFKKGSSSN